MIVERATVDNLYHYIRSQARNCTPNRTHEECYGCAFRTADPPQCLGHYEGPVSCPMFVREGTKESRLLGRFLSGCEERQITPVEHPLGIIYNGSNEDKKALDDDSDDE